MCQTLQSQSHNHISNSPEGQASHSISQKGLFTPVLRFISMEEVDGSLMTGFEDFGIEELRSREVK